MCQGKVNFEDLDLVHFGWYSIPPYRTSFALNCVGDHWSIQQIHPWLNGKSQRVFTWQHIFLSYVHINQYILESVTLQILLNAVDVSTKDPLIQYIHGAVGKTSLNGFLYCKTLSDSLIYCDCDSIQNFSSIFDNIPVFLDPIRDTSTLHLLQRNSSQIASRCLRTSGTLTLPFFPPPQDFLAF